MFKKVLYTLAIMSMVGSVGTPFISHAQITTDYPSTSPLLGESVILRVNPASPQPGQPVTFSVEAYTFNLNSALIVWKVNGTTRLSGIGAKVFNLEGTAINTTSNVTATIALPAGQTVVKSFSVQPASVDLLWEAQSYTPPFYKGKSLYTYQGSVKITAVPDIQDKGVPINRKNLLYTWRVNGSVATSDSGYGKDSLTITGGVILRASDVSVTVSNADGSRTAQGFLTLNPVNPQIVMYAESPLYGVLYNRALGSEGTLQSEELTLRAEPLNFATDSLREIVGLTYAWKINGSPITTPELNTLTLRIPEGSVKGTSNISLGITNLAKLLQFANTSMVINFDTSNQ